MKQKTKLLVRVLCLSVITLFLFKAIHFSLTGDQRFSTSNMKLENAKYTENWLRIHRLMLDLYKQCTNGDVCTAQNTFLDIQQHWQRQDLLVTTLDIADRPLYYFPSDSLVKLGMYVDDLATNSYNRPKKLNIVMEIKRINERID